MPLLPAKANSYFSANLEQNGKSGNVCYQPWPSFYGP